MSPPPSPRDRPNTNQGVRTQGTIELTKTSAYRRAGTLARLFTPVDRFYVTSICCLTVVRDTYSRHRRVVLCRQLTSLERCIAAVGERYTFAVVAMLANC